jgi:hypothetical protein
MKSLYRGTPRNWACRSTVGLLLCKQIIRVRFPAGPLAATSTQMLGVAASMLRSFNGRTHPSQGCNTGSIPVRSTYNARTGVVVYLHAVGSHQAEVVLKLVQLGTSFNGRTTVSKTVYRGSNPRGPANHASVVSMKHRSLLRSLVWVQVPPGVPCR